MAQRGKIEIDPGTLIELVRKNECLYNTRIPSYKRDSVNAWKMIAKEMKFPQQDAVDQLKNKWRLIRDTFVRRKNLNRQRLAAGDEELSWRYWEAMLWISPYLKGARQKPAVKLPSYARTDLQAISNQLSPPDESNDGDQVVDYYADVYDDLELGDTAASIKSEPHSTQLTYASSQHSNTVERDSQDNTDQIHTGNSAESVASVTISLPPSSEVGANNAPPNRRKRPHSASASSHNSKDNETRANEARFVSQSSNFAYEICMGLHHIKGEYERELAKRAIRDILFRARFPPHLYGEAARTAPHNPSTSQPPVSAQLNSEIDK